jgi:hypothetical protein
MAQLPEVQMPKALPFTLVPRPPAVICAVAVFDSRRVCNPKAYTSKQTNFKYFMLVFAWPSA